MHNHSFQGKSPSNGAIKFPNIIYKQRLLPVPLIKQNMVPSEQE